MMMPPGGRLERLRRVAALAALAALSAPLVCRSVTPEVAPSPAHARAARRSPRPPALRPGEWTSAPSPGASAPQRYRARLSAGALASLVLEPEGIDVRLCLDGPEGAERLCVDRRGDRDAERLAYLPDVSGDYGVRVEHDGAARGRYRLQLGTDAASSRAEQGRARAQGLEFEAEQALRDGHESGLARAGEACEQAAAVWLESGLARERAACLRRCAALRAAAGAYDDARQRLKEAARGAYVAGDRAGQAQAIGELAVLEAHAWQSDGQVDVLARQAQASDDRTAQALGEQALGEHAVNHGAAGAGVESLLRSLELWRALGNRGGQATARLILGDAYTLLGRNADAREEFERARETSAAVGDLGGAAEAEAFLGWLAFLENDYAGAREAYTRALGPLERLGRLPDVAGVLDRRGSACRRLGQDDAALDDYRRALELAEALGDHVGAARVLINLADVHASCDAGRACPADTYDAALARVRQAGDREALAGILLGRARLHRGRGDLRAALRDVTAAIDELEGQRAGIAVPISRMAFLAARHKFYEFLIATLQQLDRREPGAGYAERAFDAAERARARTLLDSLQEPAPPAVAGRTAAALLPTADLDRDDYLRARPLSAAPPLTLARVQRELLDDDTLLLAYALGNQGSVVWLVGRGLFESHALPPRDEIEELAREVAGAFKRSDQRRVLRGALWRAARLSDLVLGPFAARLTGRRLVIVPDGALNYVPFAALPVPARSPAGAQARVTSVWPEGREPLVARHEVVTAPSASVLLSLRAAQRRRPPAQQLVAVVADPVFERDDVRVGARRDGDTLPEPLARVRRELLSSARRDGLAGYGRLLYSGVEAEAISRLVARGRGLFLSGFAATRAAVLNGQLAAHRIVHFATHGVLDARDPRRSGLVLSERDPQGRALDPFLRVHDLARVRLNADLVVLSACRTGLGTDLRGEGLIGLTQGFLQAGALRVLVSLWAVDDRATAALMQAFYRGLLERRLTPGQALRAAQLELLARPEFAAPQHWAGFTLLGDWQNWEPPAEPSPVRGFYEPREAAASVAPQGAGEGR